MNPDPFALTTGLWLLRRCSRYRCYRHYCHRQWCRSRRRHQRRRRHRRRRHRRRHQRRRRQRRHRRRQRRRHQRRRHQRRRHQRRHRRNVVFIVTLSSEGFPPNKQFCQLGPSPRSEFRVGVISKPSDFPSDDQPVF